MNQKPMIAGDWEKFILFGALTEKIGFFLFKTRPFEARYTFDLGQTEQGEIATYETQYVAIMNKPDYNRFFLATGL